MGHGIDLRTVIIEDRSHIILWEDKSMGGLTLRDECSYLFNVTRHKNRLLQLRCLAKPLLIYGARGTPWGTREY